MLRYKTLTRHSQLFGGQTRGAKLRTMSLTVPERRVCGKSPPEGPLGPVVQGGHLAADSEHDKVRMTGSMTQRSRECGNASSNKHIN